MKKTRIITDCLDLLAGFEYLKFNEQKDCFQQIVDTLGSYPKPQKKTDTERAKPHEIACYLFVSNVRNACKLSTLGCVSINVGFDIVQDNCELALSLLVDDLEVIEPQKVK